jgi:hypothetical protein
VQGAAPPLTTITANAPITEVTADDQAGTPAPELPKKSAVDAPEQTSGSDWFAAYVGVLKSFAGIAKAYGKHKGEEKRIEAETANRILENSEEPALNKPPLKDMSDAEKETYLKTYLAGLEALKNQLNPSLTHTASSVVSMGNPLTLTSILSQVLPIPEREKMLTQLKLMSPDEKKALEEKVKVALGNANALLKQVQADNPFSHPVAALRQYAQSGKDLPSSNNTSSNNTGGPITPQFDATVQKKAEEEKKAAQNARQKTGEQEIKKPGVPPLTLPQNKPSSKKSDTSTHSPRPGGPSL